MEGSRAGQLEAPAGALGVAQSRDLLLHFPGARHSGDSDLPLLPGGERCLRCSLWQFPEPSISPRTVTGRVMVTFLAGPGDVTTGLCLVSDSVCVHDTGMAMSQGGSQRAG